MIRRSVEGLVRRIQRDYVNQKPMGSVIMFEERDMCILPIEIPAYYLINKRVNITEQTSKGLLRTHQAIYIFMELEDETNWIEDSYYKNYWNWEYRPLNGIGIKTEQKL